MNSVIIFWGTFYEAHDDIIRIYESRLRDFGIPEEELGLKTIDSNGSTVATKLPVGWFNEN